MKRRDFVRLGSTVLLGGIFVPRFERWYRLLPIRPPSPPPGLEIAWPAHHQPDDVAVLFAVSTDGPVPVPLGWNLQQSGVMYEAAGPGCGPRTPGYGAVFYRKADSWNEPPVRFPIREGWGELGLFRGVDPVQPLKSREVSPSATRLHLTVPALDPRTFPADPASLLPSRWHPVTCVGTQWALRRKTA